MNKWLTKLGGSFGLGLLGIVALAFVVIASVPELRAKFKSNLQVPERREVLAKASADFNGKGLLLTVVKVRWKGNVIVEVFPYTNLKEETSMLDRLVIPNSEDAYFMFENNSTNLALTDVDGDGLIEILVPTYDSTQNARLNAYKLRADQKGFDRMSPENSDFTFTKSQSPSQ